MEHGHKAMEGLHFGERLAFFQRAEAALAAIFDLSFLVIVSKRRFPPMRPPLRPISAMTREISDFVGGGDSGTLSWFAVDS